MAIGKEVFPVNLEDEMRQSYLDYAMSVIVGRALPDVRDGLKPVHRRVLYAMRELGNEWNRAYKKSARVVGDVIGKYHPHGEQAVYDSIVRMAQPFSLRYLLVDGQGNFGSVDGDPPAAMRYTEVRMARITQELLADIDKETVDFVPNYDESEREPSVLPTRIPNLLVNGSTGIAVGMATNIPPHNLGEVIDACLALVNDPKVTIADLIKLVPGPDFPTAGQILGIQGVVSAYTSGRGRIYVRGRTHIEPLESQGREAIVITELPYQVNKARLIERIADLVREKKLEGISEIRDESDKDGMRVVIELRRGELTDVVLNNLYKQTPLQSVFGINMVGLVDGQPRLLSLKELLDAFLRHRREVVTRRTLYDLRKARERAHVLEGLMVALANIDPVIDLIKRSPSPNDAKTALCATVWKPGAVTQMLARAGATATRPEDLTEESGLADAGYRLSTVQAQAILDLRLQRLTGLEQEKISSEYSELIDNIKRFPRDPVEPREAPAGDPRRTRRDPHSLRGQASHGDRRGLRRPHDGGPDSRRAGRRDSIARGLREVAARRGVPSAAPRRPRTRGGAGQGRRLHRSAVRHELARHRPVLLEPRQGVLAQGLPDSAGGFGLPRPAHRESAAPRGRRAHQHRSAREELRGRQVRIPRDEPRHGQEDVARGIRSAAHGRHHRGRPPARRSPDRCGDHERRSGHHAVRDLR